MPLLTGAFVSLRLETMLHSLPRPSPGMPTPPRSTAPGHRAWRWATVRGPFQAAWAPAASPAWGCTHWMDPRQRHSPCWLGEPNTHLWTTSPYKALLVFVFIPFWSLPSVSFLEKRWKLQECWSCLISDSSLMPTVFKILYSQGTKWVFILLVAILWKHYLMHHSAAEMKLVSHAQLLLSLGLWRIRRSFSPIKAL